MDTDDIQIQYVGLTLVIGLERDEFRNIRSRLVLFE
jgi:hypothetical protein